MQERKLVGRIGALVWGGTLVGALALTTPAPSQAIPTCEKCEWSENENQYNCIPLIEGGSGLEDCLGRTGEGADPNCTGDACDVP
jgi:hypothetical protein